MELLLRSANPVYDRTHTDAVEGMSFIDKVYSTAPYSDHSRSPKSETSPASLATPPQDTTNGVRAIADGLDTLVICGEDDYRFIGVSSGISIFSPLGRRWVAERISGDGFEKIVFELSKKTLSSPSDKLRLLQAGKACTYPMASESVSEVYINGSLS